MDLETENRIAKALLEEARKMRMESDKEGVHAYLRQPGVRARPNSRFLTATVLGVQQGFAIPLFSVSLVIRQCLQIKCKALFLFS
jgi:hypothetical protein